jgi:hypothetical protein
VSGKAIRRGWLFCLPLALLAVVSALSSSPARAQSPADPQPQVVYQNLNDGDVLQQPAFGIQLCFASPVNIKDLGAGGDFAFSITEPDGFGLGNRDVFQPDGYGVAVYPGNPIGDTAGQWKFHYRVTSPDAQSALEGDINYTVDPNGSPFPQETPPVCVESGGTATALPGAGSIDGTSGGSSDILKYALIAIGAAGVAAIVLILFVVRRRQGHRPTPGPTTPIDRSASGPGTTSPPPVVDGGTPLPTWSRPPGPATPPPVVESVTTVPPSSPPPGSETPPPIIESGTPLPESSRPPVSTTPTEDSVVGESAGYSPDNSKYALLAIAAAVILLIGLIFRRRGRRGKRGGDGNGNPD